MAKSPSPKPGNDKATPKAASKSSSAKVAAKTAGKGASKSKAAGLLEEAPAKKRADLPPVVVGSMRDVVGQDRAIDVLQRSLKSGRVHHAWVFHGPVGVGKFTAAVAFAATLLDPSSRPAADGFVEPDPHGPIAKLLASGSHPDLHVIVKELARFHEDAKIRASKLITIPTKVIDQHLIGPSTRAAMIQPGGLASKVFIIDEAELLDRSPSNAPAQNSILKTLEEPPPGTVIILVTSNEERLLPTIRSRSQRVAFTPLDADAMKAWVRERGLDIPREQASWLFEYAAGSPGALLDAMRDELFAWHTTLDPKLSSIEHGGAAPELGAAMTSLVDAWTERWMKRDANASKESANHTAMDVLFRMLAERCRAGLRREAGGPGQVTPTAAGWLASLDRIRDAERHAASNVSMGLVLGNLAAQWGAAFDIAR